MVDGPNLYAFLGNGATYRFDPLGLDYSNLPNPALGYWSGTPGDSIFYFTVGEPARYFPFGVSYDRGIPDFSPYALEVEPVPRITLTGRWEKREAEKQIRKTNPGWRKPAGYDWHHYLRQGRYEMQLVPSLLHEAVHHNGPVAKLIKPTPRQRALNVVVHTEGGVAVAALVGIALGMATISDEAKEEFQKDVNDYLMASERGDDLSVPQTFVLADVQKIFGSAVANVLLGKLPP